MNDRCRPYSIPYPKALRCGMQRAAAVRESRFQKLLCMEQFGCVSDSGNSISFSPKMAIRSLCRVSNYKTLSDLKAREGVIGIEQPDSGQRWVTINVIPVTEVKGGAVTGIVSSVSDVTDLKYHENQLDQMAHFDALTGLPNRRLLHDRMQQLVENTGAKAEFSPSAISISMVSKHINDTYGHKAGDGLLVEAASRFVNCVRAGDTVARLGAMSLSSCWPISKMKRSANQFSTVFSALSNPYTVAGNIESGITVSAGITLLSRR